MSFYNCCSIYTSWIYVETTFHILFNIDNAEHHKGCFPCLLSFLLAHVFLLKGISNYENSWVILVVIVNAVSKLFF